MFNMFCAQLIECPSIYEMMTNPDFKWEKQPKIEVWRKQSSDGESSVKLESYGPVESISLFEEALKNNEVQLTIFYMAFKHLDYCVEVHHLLC